jgi:hypothetical protein
MATMTRERAPVKAKAPRKPSKPTHGTCRLTLAINGTTYTVKPIVVEGDACHKAFRLRKPDGTVYDVAQHAHGHECTCPDFIWNRDGLDNGTCNCPDHEFRSGPVLTGLAPLDRPLEVAVDDRPDGLRQVLGQGEAPEVRDVAGPGDDGTIHLHGHVVTIGLRPSRPEALPSMLALGTHGRPLKQPDHDLPPFPTLQV